MRMLFLTIATLALLSSKACQSKTTINSRTSQTTPAQTSLKLDSRIPAPAPSIYKDVRDARDWRNPYLVVGASSIDLKATGISATKTIALDELAKALIALPAGSWPYGRVIAAQGNSIGSGSDFELINENKKMVEQVCQSPGVAVDWWLS